jgi:flagellar biosynthesis protein
MVSNMADGSTPKEAVALKYESKKDPAPRVTAKGKGAVAEQIIRVAEEHGLEIREDADLVQILGKLELDTIIPVDAYAAVAEILKYVYQKNDKMKKKAGL